jgi:GNAT superfamily N-acetyltransferase
MDVTCRPMTAADIDAVAELHVRAWQATYRGIMPPDFLDRMDPAVQAQRRRADPRGQAGEVVAEAGGQVVGWTLVGPYRDEDDPSPSPGAGEILAIYARPDHVGRGVGRAMLAYGLGELRRQGLVPVLLWVAAANDRARRFYEKAGFHADGATQDFEVGGATLPEVRYRLDG